MVLEEKKRRDENLLRFFGLLRGAKACELFYESSALTN